MIRTRTHCAGVTKNAPLCSWHGIDKTYQMSFKRSARMHLWSARCQQLSVARVHCSTFGTRTFSVARSTAGNSLPAHLWDPAVDSKQFRRRICSPVIQVCVSVCLCVVEQWHWMVVLNQQTMCLCVSVFLSVCLRVSVCVQWSSGTGWSYWTRRHDPRGERRQFWEPEQRRSCQDTARCCAEIRVSNNFICCFSVRPCVSQGCQLCQPTVPVTNLMSFCRLTMSAHVSVPTL